MKYSICLVLFVLLSYNLIAQSYIHPVNLDMENGSVGALPFGWIITEKSTNKGYAAALSNMNPYQGKYSLELSYDGNDSTDEAIDGSVFQSVNAIPFRGKKIKIKAHIRANLTLGTAHLWMRVLRNDSELGFYNLGEDSPVTKNQWQEVEILGTVDEQATLLRFGLLIMGKGKAYIDDVKVEVIQNPEDKPIPSRKINDREIKNLIAFSKLYGYALNFYPSYMVPKIDKTQFLYKGINNIIASKNSSELKSKLEKLFLPFAPAIKFSSKIETIKNNKTFTIEKPNDNSTPFSWFYIGANTNVANEHFMAKLIKPGDNPRTYEGIAYQIVDVLGKSKKKADFSAKVKINRINEYTSAFILIKCFSESNQLIDVFGDQVESISTNKWKEFKTDFIIPDSASTLQVSLIINGEGRAYFDDIQLIIDGKNAISNSSFEEFLMNFKISNWKMPKESIDAGYTMDVDDKNYTIGKLSLIIDVVNQKYFNFPQLGNYSSVKLDKDLYAYIPLVLYSDSTLSYPLPTEPDTLKIGKSKFYLPEASDLYSRFATIIDVWNVFKHFQLNIYDDTMLEKALASALTKAGTIETEQELKDIVKEMLSIFQDNNLRVWLNSETTAKYYSYPFTFRHFDNKYVITNSADNNEFPIGSEIISIDGKPINNYIDNYLKLCSYNTKEYGISKAIAEFKYSTAETNPIKIKIKSADGKTLERTTKRALLEKELQDNRPNPVFQIKEGYFYLDLTKLSEGQTADFFKKNIDHIKGVILDMRGLSYISQHFFGFMTTSPIQPINWKIPAIGIPDDKNSAYKTIVERVRSRGGLENVKTMVLADESTCAMAEADIQLIKLNKFCKIIGRKTAGNPGNVIGFYLPCNLNVSYTAIFSSDEQQNILLNKPIEPDVLVPLTFDSIISSKDEVYEKAKEMLFAE